ncbi:MAG: LPXTG cell wall anchor domain-containing protein [Chloroflexota bacterium]|nr:LPXTG cell wall anchor domain-containing protein [Chloroflexota bacterium]
MKRLPVPQRLSVMLGVLAAAVLAVALAAGSRSVSAQTAVPDLAKFGYSQVIGTITYTPGQTATISAGGQEVMLPVDFISKTVKFELLQGDPAFFAASLPITDQGRTILVAWAFRVTDVTTNQLIGRFDKPLQWSFTNAAIAPGSAVYNTTAASPPTISANAAPGTITGTTIAHAFGGAGVGWLVLGPAAIPPAPTPVATQPAPTTVPTQVPTTAPTIAPTSAPTDIPVVAPPPVPPVAETATTVPAVPLGMPATGSAQPELGLPLLALIALTGAAAGVVLRRRRAS